MNFNEKNIHHRDSLISFDETEHVYTFGEQTFESVTTVVENCFEKFDAPMWAARKCPHDPQSLIRQWEQKAKTARDLGTLMHDRIERYYLGETLEAQANSDPTFSKFLNFAAKYELNPYRSEWRIFSEDFQIAGTLDFLTVTSDGRFTIYDWKRSTKVVDDDGRILDKSYGRYGLGVMSSLSDTTYNHYALQVSIYRYILERHYDIEVSDAYLGVFHPDMKSYHRVALPYLRAEVIKLLNSRIKK